MNLEHTVRQITRATGALFLLVVALFWTTFSATEARLLELAVAQAQEVAKEAATVSQPRPVDLTPPEYKELLDLTTRLTLIAEGQQRIRLNGVDRIQFETYLTIHRALSLLPKEADGSWPTVNKLPESMREELGVDRLSTYDRRAIQSILNLVTGQELGGAGYEVIVVSSITKDHRTEANRPSREVVPPEGKREPDSFHFRENGQAVDVSAANYLRGTKFTIESEVEEKTGKVVKERVESIEHLPAEAIQFIWQSDEAANYPGAVPEILGLSPHEAGQRATENATRGMLVSEADRQGNDANAITDATLKGVQNIAEIARAIGEAKRRTTGELPLRLGPHALLENAQAALAEATKLPALSFRGERIDGYRGLAYNTGAEWIAQRLHLEGAIVGKTSEEVLENIGERVFEKALGDLPLGTLDGIQTGDERALKIAVGRGVVAKHANLWVADLINVHSIDDLKSRQPTLVGYMASSGRVLDNLFLLDSDATRHLVEGSISWNEYLESIGDARIDLLRQYARPDTALNLQAIEPLIGKDATTFVESLRAAERGFVERFIRADTSTFIAVGREHVVKAGTKDNEERTAIRTWLETGTMPMVEGTTMPVVDLNVFAERLGMRTAADAISVFVASAPTPIIEAIGRITLVPALTKDITKFADQLRAAGAADASLGERLEGTRAALETLRRNVPANLRSDIDRALTATDQLLALSTQVAALGNTTTATEWVTGITTLTGVLNTVANSDIRLPKEYRQATIAVAKVIDGGDAGELLYTLPTINLGPISSRQAIATVRAIVDEKQTPLEGLRDLGGMVIDQQQDLPSGTSRLFYDVIETAIAGTRQPSANEVRSAIERFARDHQDELVERAKTLSLNKYGFDIGGTALSPHAVKRSLAEAMVSYLVQPTPTDIKAGASEVGGALGIERYEVVDGKTGLYAALESQIGDTVNEVVKRIMADQKMFELITGRLNVGLSNEEQQNKYLAAMLRFGADQLGLPINPAMLLDPDYKFTADEAFFLFQAASGRSIEQLARETGIPFLDMLANSDVIQAVMDKEFFDLDSNFWKNSQFLSRLEAEATSRGVPAGVVRALLSKNLSPEEQSALLRDSFKSYVTVRLTPEFINDVFGLEGSDAALTAQGIAGAVNILLSDEKNQDGTVKDKSAAFQELGLQIADSYFAEHYGVTLSWAFDNEKSVEEKGRTGLRMLSTALGLDPAITDLADTFYEVLLLDGSLDLETPDGKANVAKLVTSFGNAAGVDGEYTVLAAAALTGDLETTLTTYAGQAFVDNQLREYGITDVSFRDIYEATVGLLPGTKKEVANAAEEYTKTILGSGSGAIGIIEGFSTFNEFRDSEIADRTREMQAEKRKIVQYALSDALLNKALDDQVEGVSLRGFSRAMFEGDPSEKLTAFTGLAAQISGSENAGLILGSMNAATELKNFFSSNEKDLTKVSPESLASIDGWMRQATGWDVPVGATGALLAFAKTGNISTDVVGPDGKLIAQSFDTLLKSDYTQMKIGGFLDKTVGLPEGTSFAVWRGYEQLAAAQQAVDAAQAAAAQAQASYMGIQDAAMQNLDVPGVKEQLQVSAKDMADKTKLAEQAINAQAIGQAQLVMMGVNLVFGKSISKFEASIGLPPGTISLIATAAFSLVFGATLTAVLSTILLPGIGFMLFGLLGGGNLLGGLTGGLFGGKKKKTKTVKRVEIIWAWGKSDPGALITPVDPKTKAPVTLSAKETEERTNPLYKKMLAVYKEKPEEEQKLYQPKPTTELTRGDWPEEAWYVDQKNPGSNPVQDPLNTNISHPGVGIAFLRDTELPTNVFRGNTKEQFLQGARRAANETIVGFLRNVLTFDSRLGDPEMLPSQIYTHQQEHVLQLESLIYDKYARDRGGVVGTYQEKLKAGELRGVLFDTDTPLLTSHVHWQY
ncbi:MAG: hypothetical protein ACOYBJ_01645 [Patescibacteria group bacterium]|jgi:hypothetical protein